MRIWDISPRRLCRQHLLAEHRELHGIWNVITKGRKGYAHHPEVMRWRGRLRPLRAVHAAIVLEMGRRGWRHATPLPTGRLPGPARQERHVEPVRVQLRKLRAKGCACRVARLP